MPSFAAQPSARAASTVENQPATEEDGIQTVDSEIKREGTRRGSRRRRGRRGDGTNRNQAGERGLDGNHAAQIADPMEPGFLEGELPQSLPASGPQASAELPALASITEENRLTDEAPVIDFLSEPDGQPGIATHLHPPRPAPVPRRHQQRPPRPRPATTYIDWVEPSPDPTPKPDDEPATLEAAEAELANGHETLGFDAVEAVEPMVQPAGEPQPWPAAPKSPAIPLIEPMIEPTPPTQAPHQSDEPTHQTLAQVHEATEGKPITPERLDHREEGQADEAGQSESTENPQPDGEAETVDSPRPATRRRSRSPQASG